MPVLCCEGTDAQFNYKLHDLVTFTPTNKDYIIIARRNVPGASDTNCCLHYTILNLDIYDSEQHKQVNCCDEGCFTSTNFLDAFTKLWNNISFNSKNDLYTWIRLTVGRLSNNDTDIVFKVTDTAYVVELDGVEFIKLL